MQGAEPPSPFGVPQRGQGRPRVRPEWQQPSSARELGSSQTPGSWARVRLRRESTALPVNWQGSQCQRPEACQSVLEGTERSQPLRCKKPGAAGAPARYRFVQQTFRDRR